MQLGFINFSQEELARKNKVLQMVYYVYKMKYWSI